MEARSSGDLVPKICCCSHLEVLPARWSKLCFNKQELRHLMTGSAAEGSFQCTSGS